MTVLARREQSRIDDDPEKGGSTQILIRDVTDSALRRTDLTSGSTELIDLPCGATLEAKCPPCAKRARHYRQVQIREGWHRTDEPLPPPAVLRHVVLQTRAVGDREVADRRQQPEREDRERPVAVRSRGRRVGAQAED